MGYSCREDLSAALRMPNDEILFSVIVSIYNTPAAYFQKCMECLV